MKREMQRRTSAFHGQRSKIACFSCFFYDSLRQSSGLFRESLSLSLLTPTEFERLISNAYDRESTLKTNTDEMTLTSTNGDWKGEILKNISEISGGIKLGPGFRYITEPQATSRDDGGLEIYYKVERTDCSQDWISQHRSYEASIVFMQKKGSLVIEALKGYTTKETDRVNAILSRGVTRHLKSKGVVAEEAPRDSLNNPLLWRRLS